MARPLRFGLLAGAGALIAFTGFLTLRHLMTVLSMLVAALFFTLGLQPVVNALMRRGLRRGLAVSFVVAAVLIVLCGAVAYVLPRLVQQAGAFFAHLPQWLDDRRGSESVLAGAITPQNLTKLATGLLGGAATLAGAVLMILTTIMLTLFMLGGFDRIKEGAFRWVPASRRERSRALGETMMDKVGAYLVGSVGIATCAATAAFLWCVITGVPYPLVMAMVVGIFDMIPQIGATLGSTVVILTALTVSLPLALASLCFFLAYQGVENWIVYPRVMSRAVKISNFAAITAAMIGGAVFGVLGVLIAVPTYASLQILVREVVFPHQQAR